MTFPSTAQTLGTLFPTLESAQISLRAGHQYKLCLLDLIVAPLRPSLRGRLLILVDLAVDAILSQPIR